LWPSVLLQHSLLASRGSLWAISVIRHPALRYFLHVEAFCAVGAVLPISRGSPVSGVLFRTSRPLRSCERITDCGASRRGRAATRLSYAGNNDAHKASLTSLPALRRLPRSTSSPFSRLSVVPRFCQSRGTLLLLDYREIVKKVVSSDVQKMGSPTDNVSTNERLTDYLSLYSLLSLSLCHSL